MVTYMKILIWLSVIKSYECPATHQYTMPPKISDHATRLFPIIRESIIGKIYNMSNDIMKDIHVKDKIVERFMDMHKGTWDFEVGSIAGALFDHFRSMLRTYRRYSNMSILQFYDEWGYKIFYKSESYNYFYLFQHMHGEFNEILYNKREFFKLLEKHKDIRNRYAGKTVQAVRRQGGKGDDLGSKKSSKHESDDYYVDFLGHRVDKAEGKRPKLLDEDTQHFQEYFDDHYEKLMKSNHRGAIPPKTKDETLKQAYEYLEKNSLEQMEREMELHLNENEREEINKKKKDFERILKKPSANVEKFKENNDVEYKKMLRLKSYEKQRAKFDPEREGIDIDLTDIVK